MLIARGNYKEALQLLNHAEKLALEKERPDALAAIYGTMGNILRGLGDFENAKKYFEQSLKFSEQLAVIDPFYNEWVATTRNNLGNLLSDEGNLSKALDYHTKALDLVSLSGNPDLLFKIFGLSNRHSHSCLLMIINSNGQE
jgi:tetratricopeptide (TPR) repeat protein